MKKLSVLAALAFVLAGSTIYARACDMGAITLRDWYCRGGLRRLSLCHRRA